MKRFSSERLILRRFVEDDFEAIMAQIYADRPVWEHYSSIAEDAEEVRRRFLHRCFTPSSATFGFWAITQPPGGRVIGQIHLEPYVNKQGLIPGEESDPYQRLEVELAFAIGQAYWGKGLAYEACTLLVDYAFSELNLPRLVGGLKRANERSRRLHERLGYRIVPDPTDPAWQTAILDNPGR